jgi:hypothetical protein
MNFLTGYILFGGSGKKQRTPEEERERDAFYDRLFEDKDGGVTITWQDTVVAFGMCCLFLGFFTTGQQGNMILMKHIIPWQVVAGIQFTLAFLSFVFPVIIYVLHSYDLYKVLNVRDAKFWYWFFFANYPKS